MNATWLPSGEKAGRSSSPNKLVKGTVVGGVMDFVENGFKETRVEDLADFIGITKKTIYNHFDSKQELLYASVEHDVNITIQRVDSLLSDISISYGDRLGILFFVAYHKIEERKKLFPDIDSPFKATGKILSRLMTRIQSELLKFITLLITNGISANHFRSELNIEYTSSMILSMLIGIPSYNFNAINPTNPNQLILESVKTRGITPKFIRFDLCIRAKLLAIFALMPK